MSDEHPIRRFADDAAVRHVGQGLLARTLTREEWTHEAHLAACLWLIAERPDVLLERDLPAIIRAYNESVGGINDDSQGYHETLTQLCIAGIRIWWRNHGPMPLAAAANALASSEIGNRNWPLSLYSQDRLLSVAARRGLILPDLGDWPGVDAH